MIEFVTPEQAEQLGLTQCGFLSESGIEPKPFLRITEERLREIVREEIVAAFSRAVPQLS